MKLTVHSTDRSEGCQGGYRDWVWRGWQIRYAFQNPPQSCDDQPAEGIRHATLLFIHGFGASIGHWRQNIEFFSGTHPTYALDLVGFGGTEKVEQAYQIQFWCEQVHDFWQAIIRRPVVIVGNSIGSLVSMAIAAQYPQMCQGVVFINLPDTTLREEMIPAPIRPLVSKIEQLFTTPFLLKPLFHWLRRPHILRSWAGIAYHDRTAITDELIEILAAPTLDRGAANTFVSLFQSMPKANFGPSARLTLPQLQMPILLLWGKCDRMIMPKYGQQFAQYNPKITFKEIDNAGHCPHDEVPDQVNQLLWNWLCAQHL